VDKYSPGAEWPLIFVVTCHTVELGEQVLCQSLQFLHDRSGLIGCIGILTLSGTVFLILFASGLAAMETNSFSLQKITGLLARMKGCDYRSVESSSKMGRTAWLVCLFSCSVFQKFESSVASNL
jgi:hypothetical protein